ncbi:hypothetical protein Pcinc_042356, partial [Petrolisthes cinctipes]
MMDFVVIKNRVYKKGEVPIQAHVASKSIWPPKLKLSKGSELYDIDFSHFSPEEREFMEARREVMVERARTIKRACKGGSTFLNTPTANTNFVYDQKHKPNIVWCPNYK